MPRGWAKQTPLVHELTVLPQAERMTEEIGDFDEELTDLVAEIEKGIDGLRKLNGAARVERVNALSGRMQRARQVLQSFKVEMRELPREQVAAYDMKAKEHHATLQRLNGDLQWAKSEAERGGMGLRNVDEMTAGELIQEADKTQDKSLASLGRIKGQIADTMQVGAETASKLKGQTEQMQNIDTDIMKVRSNLNRADLLIRAFMRKMMTDKVIMVFMCLIFCGIVTIIVYKAIDPKGSDEAGLNVPDQLVNPLGEDTRRRLLFNVR